MNRQTDRQNVYCTPTLPTHEQADRQNVSPHSHITHSESDTQNVSPSYEQAGRQTKCITILAHHQVTDRQTGWQNVLLYTHITHSRTVIQTDKICITVLTQAQQRSERPQWWSSSWSSWLHACWPLCRCQLQEEWTHQEPPQSGQSSPSADHADQTHRLHTVRTGVYKLRELSHILIPHLQGREQQTHELHTQWVVWHARKNKTKSINNNNNHF